MTAMATEYYIWKWADNDLPGQPAAVVEQLGTGDLPPSLQQFLVRKVYPRLAKVLDQCRSELSEVFVDPQVTTAGAARFIRLRHPLGDSEWLANQLLWAGWDAELTVYNATANRLIGLPKCNVVEMPEGRQLVDIERSDIPGLLHRLANQPGLAALACYDRDGNMFQVWSHHRRFAVEWQVLPVRDFNLHRIWVAGRPIPTQRRARLGTLDYGLELFSRELLEMPEVYSLWTSFLAGGQRPLSHVWRDVTRDLNNLGQPPRHRHQEQEHAFPENRFFGHN
jgi:hypothetical protein